MEETCEEEGGGGSGGESGHDVTRYFVTEAKVEVIEGRKEGISERGGEECWKEEDC